VLVEKKLDKRLFAEGIAVAPVSAPNSVSALGLGLGLGKGKGKGKGEGRIEIKYRLYVKYRSSLGLLYV